MKINTNHSVIPYDSNSLIKTAAFWNITSQSWREVWGAHIHHGYYNSFDVNTVNAPVRLLEKLTQLIDITPNQTLLDVGCGMGATAIYLSQKYPIHIVGINLSTKQLEYANNDLRLAAASNVKFILEDAHTLKSFDDNMFDIVWSLESCEQFYDKEQFIQQAFRVLKPGGKLMLATWCSDQEFYEGKKAKEYLSLCKTFSVPYMPTMDYYSHILEKYFKILLVQDWTENIKPSWHIGMEKLKTYSLFELLKLGGIKGIILVKKLRLLQLAFENAKIRYGVFIAEKNYLKI